MSSRNTNVRYLVLTIVVCALFALFTQKHSEPSEYLVIQTRHNSPPGINTKLFITRDKQELIRLPLHILEWDTGELKSEVFKKIGPPEYQLDFLTEKMYLWEINGRYDWDLKSEYSGRFLSLTFHFDDRASVAGLYPELPQGAEPFQPESLPETEPDHWDENH